MYILVEGNKIIKIFGGDIPQEYDTKKVIEVPERLCSNYAFDDVRCYDSDWNLKPIGDLIGDGLYSLAPNEKYEDGQVNLKTDVEMIIDGTVPMPEGCHIVDGRIERIITSEMKAEQLRNQRNSLLAACDWTQVADSPVDKTVWAAYRQSLRDITDQLGWPEQIIWPQRPQEEL